MLCPFVAACHHGGPLVWPLERCVFAVLLLIYFILPGSTVERIY